jgi:hypothetical protein
MVEAWFHLLGTLVVRTVEQRVLKGVLKVHMH